MRERERTNSFLCFFTPSLSPLLLSLPHQAADTTELELELQSKEREVTRLLEDVQRLQSSLSQLRESASRQVSALEEEVRGKRVLVDQLQERLAQQADYEEIKKELE